MELYIECPNCQCLVEIYELNCGIFRHGYFKNTNQQINPHLPESHCKELVAKQLIYGCGMPFTIYKKDNIYVVEKCAYI